MEKFGKLRDEIRQLSKVVDGNRISIRHAMKCPESWTVSLSFSMRGTPWHCQANAGDGTMYAFTSSAQGIKNFQKTIGMEA